MAEARIRVLVVDDHPVFREGLTGALDSERDIEVVGSSADGTGAVADARDLGPEVVVMDLHLPGISGIEATRLITGENPETAVLVLTMVEDDDSVFAAVRAGARGYLLKGSRPEDIVRAVRSVSAGEAVFGPGIAERMLGFFAGSPADRRSTPLPDLTDREREILHLIASGARNADIATTLVISPKTVRNHVSNIFAKLHVADRADAIDRARAAGLGDSP